MAWPGHLRLLVDEDKAGDGQGIHVGDLAEPAIFDGWVGDFGHLEGGRRGV
jgi:hypothetical protein